MAKGLIANGDKAFHYHLCICKPGSVSACGGSPSSIWDEGHPSPLSAYPPECGLRHKDGRSTSPFRRTSGIHGLSAREVYQTTAVASDAGGLLHHLFTLASTFADRRYPFLRHFL